MIEQLETKLVELLTAELKVSVKLFPVNPSKYSMPSALGEVLVRYVGRSPKEKSLDGAFGMKQLNFKLSFVFRKLRGESSLYETLEQVRAFLENNRLEGSEPIEFLKEGFVTESAGVWEFQQDYSFQYGFQNHVTAF